MQSRKRTTSTLPGLAPGDHRHAVSLVEELEEDMDDAREQGVMGLMRLRWEAWLDERLRGAVERKMSARQALIKAKTQTAKTEQELSETVHDGTKQGVRHEIETSQLEHLRVQSKDTYNPQIVSRIVPQLVPPNPPSPEHGQLIDVTPVVSSGSLRAPMSIHVSDAEISQEAFQVLMKLGTGDLTQEELPDYIRELEKRYPPLVAAEIIRQASELHANSLPTV